MGLNHILGAQQFDKATIYEVINKADEMRCAGHSEDLKGKIIATLFYEPSTRTRLSFESAMLKQGGGVISTENAAEFSSAIKGETIEDTIRIVDDYADCIVIRHPEDGAAARAAAVSEVPVINAGDGKGQHPTQALLDVYTICRELGRLDNFKIAMVGDLASGRTVRSLSYLLANFKDINISFVSPEHLKMRDDIKKYLAERNVGFRESRDLNEALSASDIIYMTRIQKERMSQEDYEMAAGRFVINGDNLNLVRWGARIMHPLPKIDEIKLPIEIEKTDPRVAYFRQAENGLYVRMALLNMLLKN